MQITPRTLGKVPFQIGPIGINVLNNLNPHFVRDPADRVNQIIAKSPNGVYNVTFTRIATGDTIFLPYRPDEIQSVELPANPGAMGAKKFLTANLDGCCMFLDLKNNGNIVVYHANASIGVTPTVLQSATDPTYQTPNCLTQLGTLHNNAIGHYAGTPTTLSVAVRKARYLREVDFILQHKAAQNRIGVNYLLPEHSSLSTFAGFFVSGKWEFWFQTYSQFIYKRPVTHWKSKSGFRTKNPHVTHDPYKVVECVRIFRAP